MPAAERLMPLFRFLPEVEIPKRHIAFKEKITPKLKDTTNKIFNNQFSCAFGYFLLPPKKVCCFPNLNNYK